MFHDLINLLYPSVCHICEAELLKNEELICTACIHDLPITSYHLDNENPVKKVFYGRVKIEKATALLHFRKKAGVQQLIHNLNTGDIAKLEPIWVNGWEQNLQILIG